MTTKCGTLIREARKKSGRTPTDVSRDAGLSVAYLLEIERGTRPVRSERRMRSICASIGLDLRDLMFATISDRKGVCLEPESDEEIELCARFASAYRDLSPAQRKRALALFE